MVGAQDHIPPSALPPACSVSLSASLGPRFLTCTAGLGEPVTGEMVAKGKGNSTWEALGTGPGSRSPG